MDFFKVSEHASIPEYATKYSAGFDIRACLTDVENIVAFNDKNREIKVATRKDPEGVTYFIAQPGVRYKVPTGLIFDIEKPRQMVGIYARSGNALKRGLTMANGVAVIDYDYIDEVFVLLLNDSEVPQPVKHGERIAQGVVHSIFHPPLNEGKERPEPKSDRDGGLGSTGTE